MGVRVRNLDEVTVPILVTGLDAVSSYSLTGTGGDDIVAPFPCVIARAKLKVLSEDLTGGGPAFTYFIDQAATSTPKSSTARILNTAAADDEFDYFSVNANREIPEMATINLRLNSGALTSTANGITASGWLVLRRIGNRSGW